MTKKPISFREQMIIARPDVVKRQKRNRLKSAVAMNLRALRDAQGMTQNDVAQATGLSELEIAQMESLVGALPRIEDLERFAVACGGSVEIVISLGESDRPAEKTEGFPSK